MSKLYGGTRNGGRLFEWNDTDSWIQVAPYFADEDAIFGLIAYNGKIYGCTSGWADYLNGMASIHGLW